MVVVAKRAFAVLGAALMVVSFGAISASATTTTPSARFATYSINDSKSGEVILPKGYPAATITMVTGATDGLRDSSADKLNRGGFREFLEADGAPSPTTATRHLSIRPADASNNSATVTIDFGSPVPANSVALNFGDVDVEIIDITMFDAAGNPVAVADMGLQETYNSAQASLSQDPCAVGVVPNGFSEPLSLDTPGITNSLRIDGGVDCDTDGAAAWLLPSVDIGRIVLTSEYRLGNTGRYYLWFGASRPEATITATSTTFTLGSDPVTEPLATVSFPEGIIDADFSDSDKTITYSVTDAGGTGCELSGTPLTFTATAAGTCTINAQVSDSPDFVGASTSFAITVVEPPPPPAPEPEPEPEPTPAPAPKPEPTKPPTPTEWTPGTTNFQVTTFPGVIELPPPPPPPGGGAYTFSADTASTSLCTVDRDTPTVTVPQPGTCSVTASVGATKNFSKASVTVTFTITGGPTLAATGGPAWPVWAGVMSVLGGALIVWTTLARRQNA